MQGYIWGALKVDNSRSAPITKSTMNPLPRQQAIHTTQPEDDNWTVDSADVFSRSGLSGLGLFANCAPGAGGLKEIDPIPAPEDE